MATKNNRRTVMTKMLIKDALLELMQERPISKITIKEICDLADLSRSTFYLHYLDQFALLEDIENEVLEKTFENLSTLDNELDTLDSVTFFLKYVKKNKATFGVLLCQPENRSFQQAIMNSVSQYIRSILPAFYDDEKEHLLYQFIMQGSLSLLVEWINSDFKLPEREVAELLFRACNNIVRSSGE